MVDPGFVALALLSFTLGSVLVMVTWGILRDAVSRTVRAELRGDSRDEPTTEERILDTDRDDAR